MPPRNPATEESLRTLRAAAARKPLTLEDYGQVSRILAANQDCLTYLAAAIRVVQVSLQHPAADPTAPPPDFMASGLLESIYRIQARCKEIFKPISPVVMELAASTAIALLATPVNICLSSQQLGETAVETVRLLAAWVPVIHRLAGGQPSELFSSLSWTTGPAAHYDGEGERACTSAYTFVTTEILHEPPAESEYVPGASMMLFGNSLVLLLDVLQKQRLWLDIQRPAFRPQTSVSNDKRAAKSTKRVAAMLRQDESLLPLPSGALACTLDDFMGRVQFTAAGHLLTEPAVLRNLVRPLQGLAADPGLWRGGAYAYHVQTLEDLCRWAGSFNGTPAVDRISLQLVQPTAAALGSLLQLGPGDRTGAAHLVQATLRLMTHFAATESGRTYLARSNCVTSWLGQAAGWKQQPGVLHRLLIAASAPFQKLDGSVAQCGPLPTYLGYVWKLNRLEPKLFKCAVGAGEVSTQVKSDRAFAAFTALADEDLDDVSWSLLQEALACFGIKASSILTLQPRVSALLAYTRPPAIATLRQQYGAGSDVACYLGHGRPHGLGRHVLAHKLQTLGLLCKHLAAQAPRPSTTGLSPFAEEAMPVLAEWVALLQNGGATDPYGSMAGEFLPRFVHRFAWNSPTHTQFLREHNVLQRLYELLPHHVSSGFDGVYGSVPLALACVLEALVPPQPGQLPWQRITACTETKDLPARLATAECFKGLYQQLVVWQPAVLAESAAPPLEQLAKVHHVLQLLGVVAACWGDAEAPACKVLLKDCPVVWALLNHCIAGGVSVQAACGIDAWLHFLHKQLQQGDAEQQRLARAVVVQQLGRGAIETALAQVTLPLPWPQYRRTFGLLFGDSTAFQADKARLAGAATVHKRVVASGSRPQATGSTADLEGQQQGAGSIAGLEGQQQVAVTSGPKQGADSTAAAAAAHEESQPGAASGSHQAAGDTASSSNVLSYPISISTCEARACSVCGGQPEQTFLCSRCTRVRYCSAQCQRADWKQHKLVCKQLE